MMTPGSAAARVGILYILLLLSACNGGVRPELVAVTAPTPQPPLELDLPLAPSAAFPLPPAAADLALQSSVDDAIEAWAKSRNVAYLDRCSLVTPGPQQFCDVETERDTIRLLGPSAQEIWYVVTVAQFDELGAGTGYRVIDVAVAGN